MQFQKKINKPDEQKICFRCYQTIYQLELFGPILGQFYHKTCFRCIFCDRYLDLKTFTANTHNLLDKNVYCKSHVPKTKNQYVFCEVKKETNLNDTCCNSSSMDQVQMNSESKAIESVCAKMKVFLKFSEEFNKLEVVMHEVIILVPDKTNSYNVVIDLIEGDKQISKSTKNITNGSNPVWNEKFEYEVTYQNFAKIALSISLNITDGPSNNTCLGKLNIKLDSIDLLKGSTNWYHVIGNS